MDEKIFLSTRRPTHQSKRLALSFPLHFFFSAAELIQDFYRQITYLDTSDYRFGSHRGGALDDGCEQFEPFDARGGGYVCVARQGGCGRVFYTSYKYNPWETLKRYEQYGH